MKCLNEKLPHSSKKISICDAQIGTIVFSCNSVRFVFPSGFSVISGDEVEFSSCGYIEVSDCEADEFDCYIVRREPTSSGARLLGEPISLSELANMLKYEERRIEVFLELYDFNYLHWRGVLLPHKKHGLSDNVVIEASGCFPMKYYWE